MPLTLLLTELEKPLFRADGESNEETSEGASKLGTVRMVEAILLPFGEKLGLT